MRGVAVFSVHCSAAWDYKSQADTKSTLKRTGDASHNHPLTLSPCHLVTPSPCHPVRRTP